MSLSEVVRARRGGLYHRGPGFTSDAIAVFDKNNAPSFLEESTCSLLLCQQENQRGTKQIHTQTYIVGGRSGGEPGHWKYKPEEVRGDYDI